VRTVECPMSVFQELVGELLDKGECASFRVGGTSMHPTIHDGDVLTVRGFRIGEPRVGDIVAFRRCQSLVVHRVIEVRSAKDGEPSLFRTAGDGNLAEDGLQPGDALLGRVALVRGARGEWSPDGPVRRIQGRIRAALARRPRLRAALRAAKKGCRTFGLLPGQRVSA
jgi:hypothetical protein